MAFDIVTKVLKAFNAGNLSLVELENVSTFINFADDSNRIIFLDMVNLAFDELRPM